MNNPRLAGDVNTIAQAAADIDQLRKTLERTRNMLIFALEDCYRLRRELASERRHTATLITERDTWRAASQ